MLVGVLSRDVPSTWAEYDGFFREVLSVNYPLGQILPFKRYLLHDLSAHSTEVLIDAPAADVPTWAGDSRSVFLRTFLPLNVSDPIERTKRQKGPYPAQVKLPSRELREVSENEFPKKNNLRTEPKISLDQDLNTPQKIVVTDDRGSWKEPLLDLNPQFRELDFGKVETIEWEAKAGLKVRGGLYFPPDYKADHRYPLVIQTHGFAPNEFSMDGAREWSSGYAARPLAARGFLVLQVFAFRSREEHDHYNDKMDFGKTPEQAGRNVNVAAFESAIQYLDDKGLIDRERIGILGFSRTVCDVAYVLTHSKYRFAAASLVDGIDCGYFQQMVFPHTAWDNKNTYGGALPFGDGLREWLAESPSFSLDKVRAPVRLVALGMSAVLEGWEWYVGLSLQKKPVDFLLLPDAAHFVTKPSERIAAQQGLVDWFRFWLKGEEDSDPAKVEQYARWRTLRDRAQ